jgi:hypothetical protein
MPGKAFSVIFTFGKSAFTNEKAIVNSEKSKAPQSFQTFPPSAYIYDSLY